MNNSNKKVMILSIITIATFIILIAGASYAFFQAQVGDASVVDISINANTVDTFTFFTGDPISVSLDQDNFATGAGNLSGATTATATLTANNKTNNVTEHYYLYLNIEKNTYTYSIDESTPEILLTVTDSSGNEITDISGLTHVTAGGVSGYDITTKSGLITILNNREITTTSKIEEKWNIKITFINYDKDQSDNAGNSMSAKVIIQKEIIPTNVSEVCSNGSSLASCITNLADNSDSSLTYLYYHDGTLANGISDNSYRYAGASSSVNNYVCFGSDAETCPADNLYRIIGVIDGKVKLIKSTSLGSMAWDSNKKNTWSTSSINTYLNGTYLESFTDTWKEKIATTTWKVGGNTYANIYKVVAATTYANEITSPNPGSTSTTGETESSSKIALMYASDYGFAASPTAWTIILNNYDVNDSAGTSITTNNWLYLDSDEWLVSRYSDTSDRAFFVLSSGYVYARYVTDSYAVRPVFFLESNVTYSGGKGTSSSPIRIGVSASE